MNIKKILAGTAALALSVGLVVPAAALTADTTYSGSANVSGDLKTRVTGIVRDITGSGSASVGASGNAGVSADTDSGVNVGADADISGNANTSNSAADDDSASVMGNVIVFTRADIDAAVNGTDVSAGGSGDASLKANVNFSGTPASVRSNADLSAYIATQMKADTNIAQVQASSDNVAVTYKDRVKFLGLIPATVNVTAIVDGSGTVTLSYPWYSFLFATNRAELTSKIESRVDAVLGVSANADLNANAAANAGQNGIVSGNASATGTAQANANASARAQANAAARAAGSLTAEQQARLVAEIKATLEEEFNASANADADASASANVR